MNEIFLLFPFSFIGLPCQLQERNKEKRKTFMMNRAYQICFAAPRIKLEPSKGRSGRLHTPYPPLLNLMDLGQTEMPPYW